MYGSQGDSTVWKVTNLSGCDGNVITLQHNRFGNGTFLKCNDGTITGESIMRVDSKDYISSSNDSVTLSLYVSRLIVAVQPNMVGNIIECSHDNGSISLEIGNISLLSKSIVCKNASQNQTDTSTSQGADHTTVTVMTKLPIVISSLVVVLFILLLFTVLLLLYGLRNKIWSISA